MQESQFKDHCSPKSGEEALPLQSPAQMPAQMLECCGTGCTVCVLDYHELYPDQQSQDSEMMAMLEAFEEAEAVIAKSESET